MIRINLLPAGEAERVAGKRRERATGVLVMCAVAGLLVTVHGWQQARILATGHELSKVESALAAVQGSFAEVTKMEEQKAALREKLTAIGELESKSAGPVHTLEDLSASTPERLWLTEFAESGGQVKLTGFAIDEQTIAEFLRRLSGSASFQSVDLSETSQDEKSNGKQKKFVITAQVAYAAKPAAAAANAGSAGSTATARSAAALVPAGRSER
jgi:type IV pilus assembly protein PilN